MAAPVTTRAVTLACSVCLLLLGSSAAQGQGISPPSAYQQAASNAGIPASVLFAVALQESGTNIRGRLIPWPWTLNTEGVPHRFNRRAQACAALRRALSEHRNIDVGLGQISVRYHGHRVREPCELLDPYRKSDQDEVIRCLKTQGGLDACRLSFYQDHVSPLSGCYSVNYRTFF